MALPWWGRAIAGVVLFVGTRIAATALQANPFTVWCRHAGSGVESS